MRTTTMLLRMLHDNQLAFYVGEFEWWCTWACSLLLLIKNLMKRINFLKISSHFALDALKLWWRWWYSSYKVKFSSWRENHQENYYFKQTLHHCQVEWVFSSMNSKFIHVIFKKQKLSFFVVGWNRKSSSHILTLRHIIPSVADSHLTRLHAHTYDELDFNY